MKKGLFSKTLVAAATTIGLLSASPSVFAQVKIGSNPTSIGTNENLEVEASSGSKVIVTQDAGKVGVGTTPGYTFDPFAATVKVDVLGNVRAGGTGFTGFLSAVAVDNSTTEPIFIGHRSRGTFASPTYLQSGDHMGLIAFRNHDSKGAQLSAEASENQSAGAAGSELHLWTVPNGTTVPIRRMMISNSGSVGIGIGTAEPQGRLQVAGPIRAVTAAYTGQLYNGNASIDGAEMYASGTDAYIAVQRDAGSNLYLTKTTAAAGDRFAVFGINSVVVGSITRVAGGISYNATSDIRLKENIKATHFGLTDLMKIKVADYTYKSDTKKTQTTGFLAQDLYKAYPVAVTVGGKDEKKDPWTVDYGKVTPLLVKAVQDQQAIIEKQQAKIDVLENQLAEMNKLKAEVASIKALLGVSPTTTKRVVRK